jgi:hypothetical protein
MAWPRLPYARYWRTWPVNSPFAKEHFGRGKAEGRAEGEAEAILLVLQARSLHVTAAEQSRITTCTDLAQLREWVRLAATVKSATELFA